MAKSENSLKNLKKFDSTQDREQAKINGKKGGKACQEARRRKKTQREQLELLLSLPLKSQKAFSQIESMGVNPDEIDNQMAMNVALFNVIMKGGKGSVQAYNTITEILGDTDKYQLQLEKMRQENEMLKLEQEKLKRDLGNGSDSFEDLTVLADLLKLDEEQNAEDTME